MLHHTFSLPSLLPGAGRMAVSCLSVPHLWSSINYIGHDRSRFPMVLYCAAVFAFPEDSSKADSACEAHQASIRLQFSMFF